LLLTRTIEDDSSRRINSSNNWKRNDRKIVEDDVMVTSVGARFQSATDEAAQDQYGSPTVVPGSEPRRTMQDAGSDGQLVKAVRQSSAADTPSHSA